MAASTDLVTAAEVKTYLGLTGSTHDTLIDELIDLVSEFIEDYCNTTFSSTATTDKIDGGTEFLITTRAPIISITSITDNEDSTTVTATDYDFYAESGRIYRENDAVLFPTNQPKWYSGRQRYTVVYQAGYATIPEAVKWVAYEMIGRNLKLLPNSNNKGRWTQPEHKNIEAKRENQQLTMVLTEQERALLGPYRNREV
jgi:hypothetical protein